MIGYASGERRAPGAAGGVMCAGDGRRACVLTACQALGCVLSHPASSFSQQVCQLRSLRCLLSRTRKQAEIQVQKLGNGATGMLAITAKEATTRVLLESPAARRPAGPPGPCRAPGVAWLVCLVWPDGLVGATLLSSVVTHPPAGSMGLGRRVV